jgi:hypothetical protein
LTATVVVPSIRATSSAGKASTSRSSSTARCRGGRYWKLAISASRRLSRVTAMTAGSLVSPVTSASGIGCSHPNSDPDS